MSFTVLQWNCMYGEDIEKIAAFIVSLNPDIVCLQELTKGLDATHVDTGQYLVEKLKYEGFYDYGPMVLPDGAEASMGMGIFSRFPIMNSRKIVLQLGAVRDGQIVSDERFYLETTLNLEGREVAIGTTHLPFHPHFRTTPAKQQMVETILATIPLAKPYILAGDFNTTPGTKAAKAFRGFGLKHAGPAFRLPTWTTKPFSIGPWEYETLKWRLDYVLYQGDIIRHSSKIVQTNLSDHLPIVAEFSFGTTATF